MNRNDFDDWNREAILSAALEYRDGYERYRSELIYTEAKLDRAEVENKRLREALERITKVTYTGGPEYGLLLARIAINALQEAER